MTLEEKAGHPADFEVRYRFFRAEEGGLRTGPPFQGYRCDWAYEGDDLAKTGVYMIWPEFLDAEGVPLPDGERVPRSGQASMWILSGELRKQIHCRRIQEGTRGYFMEGSRKVAEAVVTRIVGLVTN